MKLNLWERDRTCPEEKWRFKVPNRDVPYELCQVLNFLITLQDINRCCVARGVL